jgi:hypothetical protein
MNALLLIMLQNEQMHLEKVRTLDADIIDLKSLFEEKKLALLEERAKYFIKPSLVMTVLHFFMHIGLLMLKTKQ